MGPRNPAPKGWFFNMLKPELKKSWDVYLSIGDWDFAGPSTVWKFLESYFKKNHGNSPSIVATWGDRHGNSPSAAPVSPWKWPWKSSAKDLSFSANLAWTKRWKPSFLLMKTISDIFGDDIQVLATEKKNWTYIYIYITHKNPQWQVISSSSDSRPTLLKLPPRGSNPRGNAASDTNHNLEWSTIAGSKFSNFPGQKDKESVCLSVCQAVRRAVRGRLQLHTYAHNMQTKNLKALCYKAAWLAPIDSLVQNQLAPLLFILDKK